jgi:hypothetical protein
MLRYENAGTMIDYPGDGKFLNCVIGLPTYMMLSKTDTCVEVLAKCNFSVLRNMVEGVIYV